MNKPLTHLLFEGVAPPEAPKGARYGQYLFSPARHRNGEDVPEEPNTEQERNLYVALRNYISSNNHPEGKLLKVIPQIKDALKKHYYSPVLDSGNLSVYRGITMEKNDLRKILSPYGMKVERDKYVTCNLPGVLPPLKGRHLQGWSTDPGVALDLAKTYSTETRDSEDTGIGRIVVLFVARTNAQGNMFFGKPGLLADIVTGIGIMPDEEEVISIGKVEYDGFAYFAECKNSVDPADLVNAAIEVK